MEPHERKEYIFAEPKNLMEAKERINGLELSTTDIERELERPKNDPEWEKRARVALRLKTAELRYLRKWCAERYQEHREKLVKAIVGDPKSPEALLLAVHRILRHAINEKRLHLDYEEQTAYETASDYLGDVAHRRIEAANER